MPSAAFCVKKPKQQGLLMIDCGQAEHNNTLVSVRLSRRVAARGLQQQLERETPAKGLAA